jgi:predicted RNA-binding Zn-ribbon protein involved in translation (DUF1610 family)
MHGGTLLEPVGPYVYVTRTPGYVRGADTPSAEVAFWLLGEPTRMAILEALWEADAETVAFADLRKRVGAADSGRFNYHLDELADHFVAATEDGWRLTQAGREVGRAVAAGTLTEHPEMTTGALAAACLDCGGDLPFRFEEYAEVACPDCGRTVMWNEFAPAGLEDRDAVEAALAFDRWTQRRFQLAMDGVCPNCAAAVETVTRIEGDEGDDTGGLASHHRCVNSDYEARIPLYGHLLEHPAVVSFYHERGVDVTSLAFWAVRALARAFDQRVTSRDPWRAEVSMPAAGDTLVASLDEEFEVLDVIVTTDDSSGR